jgi:EmrB/QacA subfamily drug resistance transporter
MMAVSPAILVGAFPREQRGRAIGMNAIVVSLGLSSGPSIGGLITGHAPWRWIFLVNVPIGVGATLAALSLLPPSRRAGVRRFDLLGAGLLSLSLSTLTLCLSLGNELGWGSVSSVALLSTSVVTGIAFVRHERRHPEPVVDFELFRNRVFASATSSLVLSFAAGFGVAVLFPFYARELRHFSAAQTGLLLTPLPLTVALTAPISGSLADRIGTRWLAATGLTVLTLALVLLSGIDATSSTPDIAWRLSLAGLGQGLFQSPNNSALMGAAPLNRQGVASGMLATCRTIGQCLSVAISGAIFAAFGGSAAGHALIHDPPAATIPALEATFVRGFHAALVVCATLASAGIALSLTRGTER